MKPLTRQVRQSGERNSVPISPPRRTRHGLHEHTVVVLGVIYPSGDPHPLQGRTREFAASCSEVANDRQNMDVIFYDPLSCNGGDDLGPGASVRPAGVPKSPRQRKELQGRTANRVIELKAVARELELLSLSKRL